MQFGAKSDKGMLRELNEDSVCIVSGYSEDSIAFIVADGMGGHNSGEIASSMAVDYIRSYILRLPDCFFKDDISDEIKNIISQANINIYNKSLEAEHSKGMGTTLILAVVKGQSLYVGHIGDSRAYLLREGRLVRITTDHSYVEELVKNGSLTRKEAENHPKKNIITRALGCSPEVETDIYVTEIHRDDIFILCTDGLTNKLDEDEIKQIILSMNDPEEACTRLIEAANEKGGEDNITVVVFKDFKTD